MPGSSWVFLVEVDAVEALVNDEGGNVVRKRLSLRGRHALVLDALTLLAVLTTFN